MRPAVFLDRDDTLIENRAITAGSPWPGDLFDPALVRLLPGVGEGCRRMREAGLALVIVSNQGGVARGACSIEAVEATNARVRELLRAEGTELDGIYYCPHHPKGAIAPYNIEHDWRKPAPGMLLAAARDLGLDLPRSWLIGDSERDAAAAISAGIAPSRVLLVGPRLGFAQAAARVLEG